MTSLFFSLSFEYAHHFEFDLLMLYRRVAISSFLFIVTLDDQTHEKIVYD